MRTAGRGSAAGCAGTVYRARELHSRTNVVLKVMKKAAIVEEGATYQIRHEIEIHSRLKHPNIVSMYSYFQDEDSCTSALHYVLGHTHTRMHMHAHAHIHLTPPHTRSRVQCFW